jgi:hypothetical protein
MRRRTTAIAIATLGALAAITPYTIAAAGDSASSEEGPGDGASEEARTHAAQIAR